VEQLNAHRLFCKAAVLLQPSPTASSIDLDVPKVCLAAVHHQRCQVRVGFHRGVAGLGCWRHLGGPGSSFILGGRLWDAEQQRPLPSGWGPSSSSLPRAGVLRSSLFTLT